jgi:hypothetical protein
MLAAMALFSTAVGVVKALVATIPAEGLLHQDGLFPIWARWERATAWGWFAPPVLLGALLAWPAARRKISTLPRSAFVVGAVAAAAVVFVSLASTNGGFPAGLTAPFERDADYWSDVSKFRGQAEVWSTWVARQPELSLHARTHPPGAVSLLVALKSVCGGNLTAVCLAVVLLGAMGIVPFYAWAREHGSESFARRAVLLWLTVPAVLLYGATCMDMVFALPLVIGGWLLFGALDAGERPPAGPAWRLAARAGVGGVALGAGGLFTFSAVALLLAVALAAVPRIRRGGRAARVARETLAVAAASGLIVLLAARPFGFGWLDGLREAGRIDGAEWPSWSSVGYYAMTRLMDVLDPAILAGAGIAATWIALLRRGVPGNPALAILARATAAALGLLFAAGAYKIGETGRIFLFLLPAVVLPVAKVLEEDDAGTALAAAAGFVQGIVMEAVLDTRW